MSRIDDLLNTPYWIIDILPMQVPKDSPGICLETVRYITMKSLKTSKKIYRLNGSEGRMFIKLDVTTMKHTEMQDITRLIQKAVSDSGVKDGICTVFVPHTTAAVTINENADPDVVKDFTKEINKIVPWEDGYLHMEGNSAAHLKSSMIGFSEQIIIDNGRLVLGTWQGLYFCEFDGPRNRKVYVKILE